MGKLEIFINSIYDVEDLFFKKPYFKIEEDNKIIAIMEFFNLDKSNIEITKIVVHPDYRNIGNGEDLINQALSLYDSVSVDKNIENVTYFESLNFIEKNDYLTKTLI